MKTVETTASRSIQNIVGPMPQRRVTRSASSAPMMELTPPMA